MARTGTYPLAADFGALSSSDVLGTDPYWIVAVIRLGETLTFNRKKMGSDSNDLSAGASLRADHPMVITDDCIRINVSMNKSSHTKMMSMSLKQTDVNYLTEILPGDWVLAWMVNNRNDFNSLIDRIGAVAYGADAKDKRTCNGFHDGFKFLGRVEGVYKDVLVDPQNGTKVAGYNITSIGFKELDTSMYYDYALATADAQGGDFGWLARFGTSVDALFGSETTEGIRQNNINNIIPTLLDLVLGHGPVSEGDISTEGEGGSVSATPQLAARNESQARGSGDVPYSYLVPASVGRLLGKKTAVKGLSSYTDIVELWTGVQSFPNKDDEALMHVPGFVASDGGVNRRVTDGGELKGTFLPFLPDFANRPIWGIMQQYVNHAINEIYTALKVNPDGLVVPTVVFRQIPFTTDAFVLPSDAADVTPDLGVDAVSGGASTEFVTKDDDKKLEVTRFLDLPRWHISPTMVRRAHVGRSNATRVNFVHIYGTSTYLENGGIPTQYQMLTNKPIQDAVDIFRSGIHPYQTTVDCWVDDQVGKSTGQWMALVADWMMGSHLTLNGTIECYGIQSPIAEGDNVLFDGVVYHVMAIEHSASIDVNSANKTWTTTLQLTNGMRDMGDVKPAYNDKDIDNGLNPIYPGFIKDDNTKLDPGLTLEQGSPTTGGDSQHTSKWDDPQVEQERQKSQLNKGDVNNKRNDQVSLNGMGRNPRNEDDVDELARTGVTEVPGENL